MKRFVITMSLLVASLTALFGQTATDSITMTKVFGGYQFHQGEKSLTLNQLVRTMEPNEMAYEQIKAAQSTNTLATVIGVAGGLLVGFPVGTAIGGGDPNWVVAGIGAGLILVCIPISQKFNKQAKQAVETYNGGLQTSSFWDKKELNFAFTGHGFGLTLSF